MMSPAAFPRRVLFTVTGLTPQIVTETIYGLAVKQTPPFLPTQLVVMTTSDGANRARLTLQGNDPGWLRRLCKDYDLPPIQFGDEDIRVLRAKGGAALPDIRSGEDNDAAADAIVATIGALTADPDCALHVSLAGGRKTLGFFAAYALSLYGRPQDRLSHVLVSPAFEASTEFYYPTRYSNVIYTRDGTPLNTRDTAEDSDAETRDRGPKVELADIPFVRMRDGLLEALRTGQASYRDAVAAAQDRVRPARLAIDLGNGQVWAGGKRIELRPVSLAFYAWIARAAKSGRRIARTVEATSKSVLARDAAHAEAFLAEYGKLRDLGEFAAINDTMSATMKEGLQPKFFSEGRSKLNAQLRQQLIDAVVVGPYLVQAFGKRGHYEYGLGLAPEAITIVER